MSTALAIVPAVVTPNVERIGNVASSSADTLRAEGGNEASDLAHKCRCEEMSVLARCLAVGRQAPIFTETSRSSREFADATQTTR